MYRFLRTAALVWSLLVYGYAFTMIAGYASDHSHSPQAVSGYTIVLLLFSLIPMLLVVIPLRVIASFFKPRLAVVLATLALCSAAQAGEMFKVVDGDTLRIGAQHIRIWGIDAPESLQTCQGPDGVYSCGGQATLAMIKLTQYGPVTCVPKDIDRYKRTVAVCSNHNGLDLGAEMVKLGWARDYTRYSHGRYASEEALAKQEGIGIWQGSAEAPWEYRHRR